MGAAGDDATTVVALEVDVGADAEHGDGAAGLVVAGMVDQLDVEGGVEAAPVVGVVVGLEDVFA